MNEKPNSRVMKKKSVKTSGSVVSAGEVDSLTNHLSTLLNWTCGRSTFIIRYKINRKDERKKMY